MEVIVPELLTSPKLIWSSDQDKTLRKFNLPNYYRYGIDMIFSAFISTREVYQIRHVNICDNS